MFRLTDPEQSGYLPSWSPDGRLLAYMDGYNRFVIVDAEGRVHVDLRSNGNSAVNALVWSPDGSKFAGVGSWGAYSWLWVMNADGSGFRTIVDGVGYTTLPRPAWSPDGSRILFSKTSATYVVAPDGTNEQKLLDSAIDAVWSPDGRQITYAALDQDGKHVGLGVARADGSDPHLLAQGDIRTPSWSPNGTMITFVRAAGTSSTVSVIGADGAGERAVSAPTALPPVDPVWSPDGGWIAFMTQGEDLIRVRVVRPDGTGQLSIRPTAYPTHTLYPTWRPSAALPQHRRRCVINGTARRDVIRGTARGDVIVGGAGADRISGGDGPDVLVGGTGRDRVYGGAGDDFFDVNDGIGDRVWGGPGSDWGFFDGQDWRRSVEGRSDPG